MSGCYDILFRLVGLHLTFRTSRKRYDRIYVMACQVV